jgi:hypothetical protein
VTRRNAPSARPTLESRRAQDRTRSTQDRTSPIRFCRTIGKHGGWFKRDCCSKETAGLREAQGDGTVFQNRKKPSSCKLKTDANAGYALPKHTDNSKNVNCQILQSKNVYPSLRGPPQSGRPCSRRRGSGGNVQIDPPRSFPGAFLSGRLRPSVPLHSFSQLFVIGISTGHHRRELPSRRGYNHR